MIELEHVEQLSQGEERVLHLVRDGIRNPTEMARQLGVSTSAVSQQLKRLMDKNRLTRRRRGKTIEYGLAEPRENEQEHSDMQDTFQSSDWVLLKESLEALNKVWGHVLKLDLSPMELKKLRDSRNLLEEILHDRRLSK